MTPHSSEHEEKLIPQWAIAVIVIGIGGLLFIIIFGVSVVFFNFIFSIFIYFYFYLFLLLFINNFYFNLEFKYLKQN